MGIWHYRFPICWGYLALTFPIWCGCPVGIWQYDSLFGVGTLRVFGTKVPYLVWVPCGYLALKFLIWCGCPVGIWHYRFLIWCGGPVGIWHYDSLFKFSHYWECQAADWQLPNISPCIEKLQPECATSPTSHKTWPPAWAREREGAGRYRLWLVRALRKCVISWVNQYYIKLHDWDWFQYRNMPIMYI